MFLDRSLDKANRVMCGEEGACGVTYLYAVPLSLPGALLMPNDVRYHSSTEENCSFILIKREITGFAELSLSLMLSLCFPPVEITAILQDSGRKTAPPPLPPRSPPHGRFLQLFSSLSPISIVFRPCAAIRIRWTICPSCAPVAKCPIEPLSFISFIYLYNYLFISFFFYRPKFGA